MGGLPRVREWEVEHVVMDYNLICFKCYNPLGVITFCKYYFAGKFIRNGIIAKVMPEIPTIRNAILKHRP